MRNYKTPGYGTQIKWRIRILYLLMIAMLVYMVAVAELGGGDSRIMTAFYVSFWILVIALVLKAGAYFWYSRL